MCHVWPGTTADRRSWSCEWRHGARSGDERTGSRNHPTPSGAPCPATTSPAVGSAWGSVVRPGCRCTASITNTVAVVGVSGVRPSVSDLIAVLDADRLARAFELRPDLLGPNPPGHVREFTDRVTDRNSVARAVAGCDQWCGQVIEVALVLRGPTSSGAIAALVRTVAGAAVSHEQVDSGVERLRDSLPSRATPTRSSTRPTCCAARRRSEEARGLIYPDWRDLYTRGREQTTS